MNWAQFKDPVSHMCLASAMIASVSLKLEAAGSKPFNDRYGEMVISNCKRRICTLGHKVVSSIHIGIYFSCAIIYLN